MELGAGTLYAAIKRMVATDMVDDVPAPRGSRAVIALLLYGALRSWGPAVLVLANLPFAAVGGIVALWLRGFHLGVSAAIGFIALFGVSSVERSRVAHDRPAKAD